MLAVTFAPFAHADFWIGAAVIAGIYGIFTIGLQLNIGYTGILNFGQAGFMAVGAYAMGILVVNHHWSFWLALPVATLAAMLSGLLIGIPSLRLRSDYFAIATIAFAEIVRYTGQNANFTGGNQGILGFDQSWRTFSDWALRQLDRVGLGDQIQLPMLIVVWVAFALLVLFISRLQRTPWGRVLRAIREDEDAARALGKNVFVYKLQSLMIAAAMAAIAGYFLALNVTIIYPNEFEPTFTFFGYAILVLGGFGSYFGVIAGAVLLWTILEGTRLIQLPVSADQVGAIRFMIVGFILVVIMAFRPQGLLGKREEMLLRRD
jgi:ABC-type branched-subunit amino acid transport system permease subunit